ncbi:DNA cytosine methyltransferase [Aquimarina hainanensis]|uniref:DNA (cytosine-5-)-methyltransferase n=1 Tax=Aquimarina hainanensis TaxID=1578017 RepID=A0ABW5NC79_9FLAO
MNKLELFSGCGVFRLGFENAGYKFNKVIFSEINKHAIANYNYNFKKSIYAGSVIDIRSDELPEIDIISFGSPCQDFSIAGNGVPMKAGTLTAGGNSGGLHSDMTVIPVLTPDRLNKRQNGRRFKNEGEAAFTLNCQDKHGVMITKKHGSHQSQIRRLTEIECERLQGLPDDWTKYGLYEKGLKEIAKTRRYEMIGNAVSEPVVREVAKRIKKCLI